MGLTINNRGCTATVYAGEFDCAGSASFFLKKDGAPCATLTSAPLPRIAYGVIVVQPLGVTCNSGKETKTSS